MGSTALFLRRVGLVVGLSIAGSGCIDATQFIPLPPSAPLPRLPQNDAYQGSVITGKLQPRFAWDASTAAEASKTVTYELQYSADATFPSGSTVTEQTTETFHQPAAALPVSTTPPVGRRYYWRVRACVAANCSAYSRTWWVNLGRSGKDLNGDGYADVAVGAPHNDELGLQSGKVYVYFGGPSPLLEATPDGSMTGSDALDLFGSSLTIAGDLNGDGFSDLVVGAPHDDAFGEGNSVRAGGVLVYYGGAGRAFDGTADVILSGTDLQEQFGAAVTSPGDLNGDGYSDLVVGSPYSDAKGNDAGRAYVYFGRAGNGFGKPAAILDGEQVTRQFGSKVEGAGDHNGDGLADFVVDERPLGIDLPRTCQSHLYYGSEGALFDSQSDMRIYWDSPSDCAILTMSAGDLDGDGFSDLATSLVRTYPDITSMFVYRGGDNVGGPREVVIASPTVMEGREARSVGDVNGDGYGDLAMVIYPQSGNVNLEIFFGRPDGLVSTAPAGVVPGAGVKAAAGDVNGDGLDDIILGVPAQGAGGRAYVYFGGEGKAFDAIADGTLEARNATEAFGSAVASLSALRPPRPMARAYLR
jgi:FG-GAP repeat